MDINNLKNQIHTNLPQDSYFDNMQNAVFEKIAMQKSAQKRRYVYISIAASLIIVFLINFNKNENLPVSVNQNISNKSESDKYELSAAKLFAQNKLRDEDYQLLDFYEDDLANIIDIDSYY